MAVVDTPTPDTRIEPVLIDLRTRRRGGVRLPRLPARPPTPASAAPPTPAVITYQPAIDGLRGLAVAGVLFFHGGFTWAKGGFLGVSTFFTLSGFLITTAAGPGVSRQRPGRPAPRSGAGASAASCRPRCSASPASSCSGRSSPRRPAGRPAAATCSPPWPTWPTGASSSPASPTPTCSPPRRRCCTSGRWPSRSSSTWCSPCWWPGCWRWSRGSRRVLARRPGGAGRAGSLLLMIGCSTRRATTRPRLLRHRHPGRRAAGRRPARRAARRPAAPAVPHARGWAVTAVGGVGAGGHRWYWWMPRVEQTSPWLYQGGLTVYAVIVGRRSSPAAIRRGRSSRRCRGRAAPPARPHLLRRLPLPLADLPVAHPRADRTVDLAAVRAAARRDPRARRCSRSASSSSRSAPGRSWSVPGTGWWPRPPSSVVSSASWPWA